MPAEEKPRAVRIVYQDGNRVSGDLVKIEKGSLFLKVPGVEGTVQLAQAGLRSLIAVDRTDNAPLAKDESTGRHELDKLRLTGKLVDGSQGPGVSSLTWKPLASETSSAMVPAASGRIIYKESPPQQSAEPQYTGPGNANQAQIRAMQVQAQRLQAIQRRRLPQMLAVQQQPGGRRQHGDAIRPGTWRATHRIERVAPLKSGDRSTFETAM